MLRPRRGAECASSTAVWSTRSRGPTASGSSPVFHLLITPSRHMRGVADPLRVDAKARDMEFEFPGLEHGQHSSITDAQHLAHLWARSNKRGAVYR